MPEYNKGNGATFVFWPYMIQAYAMSYQIFDCSSGTFAGVLWRGSALFEAISASYPPIVSPENRKLFTFNKDFDFLTLDVINQFIFFNKQKML